jgi:hypothetical protein
MDRRLLDEDEVMQICFVTHDALQSAAWFSDLTGKPVPPEGRAAEPEAAQAVYDGRPARVGCRIRMFKFGNIDVEFLEPGPEPSAWRDLLDEKGPGSFPNHTCGLFNRTTGVDFNPSTIAAIFTAP